MKSIWKLGVLFLLTLTLACGGGDPNIETAKMEFKNKNYDKAIEFVGKAIEENGENAYAHYYRGYIYEQLAKETANPSSKQPHYVAMAASYNKATELYKAITPPAKELALMELSLNGLWAFEHNKAIEVATAEEVTPADLEVSVAHLKNAITISPDSIKSLDVLGEVYMMANNPDAAIATFREASAKSDLSYTRALRLAGILGQSDRGDEKIALLMEARTAFPDSIRIIEELAQTYLNAKQTDKAIAVVKDLVDSAPENPNYRLVYGTQVYQAVFDLSTEIRKSYDEIFSIRRRLRKASKDSVTILNKRMAALEKKITTDKAEMNRLDTITLSQMDKVVELDPKNHTAYNTKGIVFQNRAAIISAEMNALDAAAKDYYKKSDELDAKAKATLRNGLPFYEKAAELNPGNKDYWNSLFRLYTTLNMMDKANAAYDKANQ